MFDCQRILVPHPAGVYNSSLFLLRVNWLFWGVCPIFRQTNVNHAGTEYAVVDLTDGFYLTQNQSESKFLSHIHCFLPAEPILGPLDHLDVLLLSLQWNSLVMAGKQCAPLFSPGSCKHCNGLQIYIYIERERVDV